MKGRKRNHFDMSSKNEDVSIKVRVNKVLEKASVKETKVKSGWCLHEGLAHVSEVEDDGRMIKLIEDHGVPSIYNSVQNHCRHENKMLSKAPGEEESNYNPKTSFQSLCRIISGQQLSGGAARTVWNRLLQAMENNDLNPDAVIKLTKGGDQLESCLQKPAGLSRTKAQSILALAQSFQDGNLTETFFASSSDKDIRESLLKIRGIGPWSCDMFLMFFQEKADVFPVGDLGVRKGIAKYFSLLGKKKDGRLCAKKDLVAMEKAIEKYKPYRSLFSYYMWKVADTKDFYDS